MFLLATLAIASVLLVAATGAQAETPQYVTIGELGKVNPEDSAVMPAGEWRYINGLDVNQKTGNIYALDPNMSRVQVFDPEGKLLFTFGEEGENGGQFGKYSSQGLAIDQETGEVYVGEAGGPFSNSRVSKFDETGKFILTFGKEVNATTEGDICTAASGNECRAGNTHEGGNQHDGEISQGAAPLVNQLTHAVLVPSPGTGRLQEFSPGGAFVQSFPVPGIGEFLQSGPEFLYGRANGGANGGTLQKWTSTGSFVGYFSPGLSPGGDFGLNQIYLAGGTDTPSELRLYASMYDNPHGYWAVGEWSLGGELLQEHAPGLGGGGQIYVATDPTRQRIYVTNGYPDGRLFILGEPISRPIATIEPVSGVTTHSATLHGKVNPEGSQFSTGYHFEYRRDSDEKWTNFPKGEGGLPADVDVGKGTSDVPVTQEIDELDPNTLYHVRLVATRREGGGTAISEETAFTTQPVLPVLDLIAATHVTDTHATLQADLDPRHAPTTYYFKYGTDTSYGNSIPLSQEGDGGSQLGPLGVFEQLNGLAPDTTYHFRLVAESIGGTAESDDLTFHTYSAAEQNWPARDIELVNNPDKGNQNAYPIFYEKIDSLSDYGDEVLWQTFSGAPGGPSGFDAVFLAKRDAATGWHSTAIGPRHAEEMFGSPMAGDLYYAVQGASKDLSTYVINAQDGFFDENHQHLWVKVGIDGEQELMEDTGRSSITDIFISDDGEHVVYKTPAEEFIDFHDGIKDPISTPSCEYEVADAATDGMGAIFVHSTGNEPSCESPGVYILDLTDDSVTNIAPGGKFVKATRDGSVMIFNKGGDFYKWTAGGTSCMSCGTLPPGVEPGGGVVSDDLSHIYFSMPTGLYEMYNGTVKRISRTGGAEAITPDGSTILFSGFRNHIASADLTGWNEKDGSTGASNEEQQRQLYRYSDKTGFVECVSCTGTKEPQEAGIGGSVGFLYKMSADGSTIAFATDSKLDDEDINGRVDVYEWHNGVTRLVTDGESEFSQLGTDSPGLWGLSTDGRTIIFGEGGVHITGNELDHLTNAYAAVVGGPGFPPPNPPAHCVEDSCQGPLQPTPVLETQGSEKFKGQDNPVPDRNHRGRNGKRVRGKHKKPRHGKHKKHQKHGRHATPRNG